MACQTKQRKWRGAEFREVIDTMISPGKLEALCVKHGPVPRRAHKLETAELIRGLVYHQLQPAGNLGVHTAELQGLRMSESAYAQRRQRLPAKLFEEMMVAALRPLADPQRQPECFYAGWRVVGIDGTEWSVTNIPAIVAELPKATSRRFKAAFAKVRLVTAVELGVHNPLAAAAGPVSQGEQTLAGTLWCMLPDRSLVIVDRQFGTPCTLWEAQEAWGDRPMAFLARVRENIRTELIEPLADGSAIMEVKAHKQRRQVGVLRVREIRAEAVTRDGRIVKLRFWTSLLDPKAYPAEALARHYIERWEHELYYRQLKMDIRGSDVLASHTVTTALQEIAALVLATAVVAHLRIAAAESLGVPPRGVSFRKVLLVTQNLWQTFAWGHSLFTATQRRHLAEQSLEKIRLYAVLPKRRPRSCPRVLRRTMSGWPRKLSQPSHTGRVSIRIVRLS
jgi:hypothetical protein